MMDIAIMIDTFNFQTVLKVIMDANPGSLVTPSFPWSRPLHAYRQQLFMQSGGSSANHIPYTQCATALAYRTFHA